MAPGSDLLEFQLGEQIATKDLAIGDGFMRTGKRRPVWQWSNVLFNPSEEPFPPGSPIESIETDYPPRDSWTSGTNSWIIYWFAVSMIAAFSFRRALHVNL